MVIIFSHVTLAITMNSIQSKPTSATPQKELSERVIKEVRLLEDQLKLLQNQTHNPASYSKQEGFPSEERRATLSTNAAIIGFWANTLVQQGKISPEACRIFNQRIEDIVRPKPQYPQLKEWSFPSNTGKKG